MKVVTEETKVIEAATLLAAANVQIAGQDAILREVARYLCRLEWALVKGGLSVELEFPGEASPRTMAETMCPGFKASVYAEHLKGEAAALDMLRSIAE